MRGAIWSGLCDPATGMLWRLPGREAGMLREMLDRGRLVVDDQPSPRARALVGAGPSDHLLGLYTAQPNNSDAMIQVFANEAIAARYDPVDIVRHEAGHLFEYNHYSRVALVETNGDVSTVCADCERRPPTLGLTRNAVPHKPGGSEKCPVCQTAHPHGAAGHVPRRAAPAGAPSASDPARAGGTILLVRRHLDLASAALPAATPLLSDRAGELRQFSSLLERSRHAVQSWQTPETVSAAYAVCYRTWDVAYDLYHSYWLHALYGSAAA